MLSIRFHIIEKKSKYLVLPVCDLQLAGKFYYDFLNSTERFSKLSLRNGRFQRRAPSLSFPCGTHKSRQIERHSGKLTMKWHLDSFCLSYGSAAQIVARFTSVTGSWLR